MAVYLDNNATTPLKQNVKEVIKNALEVYGNPSSVHKFGMDAKMMVDNARREVAALFNARHEQVVFTSGGTESNVMAMRGVCSYNKGKRLVISSVEHASVINTAKAMQEEGFANYTAISVNSDGIINLNELDTELAKGDVCLVSIIYAGNETGVIQPVSKIAEICKKHKVLLHVDAVQAAGKLAINFNTLGADLISISGHKIGAPKGIGALFIKPEVKMNAYITGGSHEKNRRAGTENTIGIAAFGAACVEAAKGFNNLQKVKQLKDKLEAGIKAIDSNIVIVGENVERTVNTTNIVVKNIEGETLVMALDMAGFAVSSGSACSSGRVEPSDVLISHGFNKQDAKCGLRISLGVQNTEQEIESFLLAFKEIINRFKK